jgi:hypothetical protein
MDTPSIQFHPPMREKYWNEKSANEKIETLADFLATAHRQIRNLTERLDEYSQHHHQPVTGLLLVPMRDQYAFNSGRIGPPGYCHEDFALGRAAPHLYPPATPGWRDEAQAQQAMPAGTPTAAPPTGAGNASYGGVAEYVNPLGALDKPVEQPDGMGDPDWPKEPANPQFHPKPDAPGGVAI